MPEEIAVGVPVYLPVMVIGEKRWLHDFVWSLGSAFDCWYSDSAILPEASGVPRFARN